MPSMLATFSLYMKENMAHIISTLFLGGDLPYEKRSPGARSEKITIENHGLDIFDRNGYLATKLAFCLTPDSFIQKSVEKQPPYAGS